MAQKKLTIEEAKKILANPKDVEPLRVAHATRMVNAAERATRDPVSVAQEDFAGKVNQVVAGLTKGGRNTLVSMISRFQGATVKHRATEEHPEGHVEEIPALLTAEQMTAGLDYIQAQLDECRQAVEGSTGQADSGFSL